MNQSLSNDLVKKIMQGIDTLVTMTIKQIKVGLQDLLFYFELQSKSAFAMTCNNDIHT